MNGTMVVRPNIAKELSDIIDRIDCYMRVMKGADPTHDAATILQGFAGIKRLMQNVPRKKTVLISGVEDVYGFDT